MADDKNQLNEAQLAQYLEAKIPGFQGPLSAKKFPGGQSNPTYLLTAVSGKYVLRRKPPGVLLPSAHAVDREFRVIDALAKTKVPVAQALHLCEDDAVIGSAFYVMSFVDGNIYWQATLPELTADQRTPVYHQLIDTLAKIHNVNLAKVGLSDYGKPGSYFARQIDRWTKQYRQSETDVLNNMEALMEWLPNNIPPDDKRISLIHGDYRLDNLIFSRENQQILAVLDWELSTLGHPFADIAYFCMCLRLPTDSYISGLAGLNRRELGIPEEQELLDRYCKAIDADRIEHWNFYLAFSFFRLAAIVQGVKKRALQGNASNEQALKVGAMTGPLAEMAVDLI